MGRLTHTVSGSIASIRTPSRVPIESLKFHFLPKQASGTPTPANPIPIEGWTGLNGCRAGVNLWDEVWEIGRINASTGKNDNNVVNTIRSKNYIPCKPGTKYFIKHSMGTNGLCLFFYDKNKNFISYGWKYSVEVTVPNDCYYLRFYLHNSYGTEYNNDVGINYPSSKTSYVKYIGNEEIPITFPVTGTNILDIEQTSKINAGASGSIITIQNGVISIDAVASSARSFVMFSQVFPAGTYTIRAAYSGSVTKPRLLTTIEIANSSYNSYYSAYSKQLASEYMSFTANESFSIGLVLSNSPNESGNPGSLYDIQLEHGDVAHNYEPYSSDNTFYGGYVDPVAGEIVAEWAKYTCTGEEAITKWVLYGSSQNIAAKLPHNLCYANYIDGGKNAFCNIENQVSNIQMYYGNTDHGICVSNNGFVTIQVDGITTLEAMSEWLADNKPIIVYQLATPIHIPISPQTMKAFLDHNNFWSDANDVTEVTYPVTESMDILATRKRIMSQTWDMIPLKYQPVEYISAKDSNPYIDMGIQLTGECEMEVHYYNDKSEAFLFGARKNINNQPYCNFNIEKASDNRSRLDYGNKKGTVSSGLVFAGYHDGEFIFKFHNRTATIERVSTGETLNKDFSDAVYVSYPDYNLLLFAANTNGTPSLGTDTGELRVYSAKFWLGGQLVRDLVPCVRKSDSKPGMYDRVSKTFFINVGSDEFAIPT